MTSRAHSTQSGAVLLVAMLIVALVAIFSTGALWQQWKAIEVESAERQRTQARWLLTGALDWACVILHEDALKNNTTAATHLSESWALPQQEARLSSLLGAQSDGADDSVEDEKFAQQVFLSIQIQDVQGRLNITNLLQSSSLDNTSTLAFERLFDVLGIPPEQLQLLILGLRAVQKQNSSSPLMPQRINQLSWFGMSPQALQTLSPHITALSTATAVNLNTASVQVLYASVPGLSLSDAARLVQQRERQHWENVEAFQKAWGGSADLKKTHDIKSTYFEVLGRLRMTQTTLQEHSLVQREGSKLRVLWREPDSLQ